MRQHGGGKEAGVSIISLKYLEWFYHSRMGNYSMLLVVPRGKVQVRKH